MNSDSVGPRLPSARTSLSPRKRKLRWTLFSLALAGAFAVIGGVIIYFLTRPQHYNPAEKNSEITSSLSRNLPTDAPTPRLTDVTREAGLGSFRNFSGNRTSQLPEDMGPGAAWGDFDNDGDDDLFLVSAGGPLNFPAEKLLRCELYENLGNGKFRRVESFPDVRIHGMAAAWGDYDGDGFLDLAISGYNELLLFHNERGTGKFVREARFPSRKGFWSGLSWGDYNNDRALDLYVCGYVQYTENDGDRSRSSEQLGMFVPYSLNPASYQPALNLLFRNNGDGTFTEGAKELGVTNPTGRSLGALWHDFDDDGWLDLYVANDVSDNAFFHNVGGEFEDTGYSAWVADYRSAMGLTAGDYDRDGDDDLFITHWVAQENALYDNLWADFNSKRIHASPSFASPSSLTSAPSARLLPNDPTNNHVSQETRQPASEGARAGPNKYPIRFIDIADRKGLGQIALPFVGWGTEFADFDGDGWLDLIVANGNTIEFEGPAPKRLKPQEPFLFWNRRGEGFFNLAPLNKSLSEEHVSRGLAISDFDNDGDLDILIVQLGEGVQLLRNDMQTGHWLKLRLRSKLKNGAPLGFGDGAKVIAHVRGVALRRTVSSASYLSQSSRTVHFGLGEAAVVDQLEVRWLGGPTNFFSNLAANTTWEITEDDLAPKQFASRSSQTFQISENERGSLADRELFANVSSKDSPSQIDKAQLIDFWNKQRAAMDALKVGKDLPQAIQLFRAAIELNPLHEDSRYYLGQCLAAMGDVSGALGQWQELIRINPQSHRAYQQWGILRAQNCTTLADRELAEKYLEKAHALNPEETGALLALGEIALMRGEFQKAEQRLSAACRTNPKAAGGFFLRGYLAFKRGDAATATKLLVEAREAFGKDWKPKGSTAEGDVRQVQHRENTPLSAAWESWDGTARLENSFAALKTILARTLK